MRIRIPTFYADADLDPKFVTLEREQNFLRNLQLFSLHNLKKLVMFNFLS